MHKPAQACREHAAYIVKLPLYRQLDPMLSSEWISAARASGWMARRGADGLLRLKCARQGCKGEQTLSVTDLDPVLRPCKLPHVGQYGLPAYKLYQSLVEELKRRRRALGLSQEDINAAAGLSDGHINKLEALHRTAQFPTLSLWTETLGLSITLTPCALPSEITAKLEYPLT